MQTDFRPVKSEAALDMRDQSIATVDTSMFAFNLDLRSILPHHFEDHFTSYEAAYKDTNSFNKNGQHDKDESKSSLIIDPKKVKNLFQAMQDSSITFYNEELS